MLKRARSIAIAHGRLGIKGTRMSSRFDGMCVATIVCSSPMRLASRVAESAEMPASTLAPKKMLPSAAGSTPNRLWNHQATKACTTKPPAKASIVNRPASLKTLPRERSRPRLAWNHAGRACTRLACGGSTELPSLRNNNTIAAPITA